MKIHRWTSIPRALLPCATIPYLDLYQAAAKRRNANCLH
ncbi:unnamed protein product [Ciceribacter sp. T2.26MG-112.2]|nr:unnamed protein product [Ciceribacter naphthalenivorans]